MKPLRMLRTTASHRTSTKYESISHTLWISDIIIYRPGHDSLEYIIMNVVHI